MNTTQILKFAKISAITYDNPKVAKNKFADLGYNIVEFFDVKGAQAYLLKGSDDHVLSFRGTEVSQPSDVVADLKTGKNIETSGGKVHVGFKGEVDKVWPAITKSLANVGALYVTGHSLGAAMATIAAGRISSQVIALVTFGSPRVGNRAFVNSLSVNHYRVQNNCDAVTKVPFLFLGFRHHGTHKYMNFHGEFRDLTLWQMIKDMLRSRLKARMKGQRFIGVFDHMMTHYIAKLEKLKDNIL
jgi:triacylglycerol lipase